MSHQRRDPNNDAPRIARNEREAIAVVQQDGITTVIGNESKEEWIRTESLGPVAIEDCR